jgi:hypothetical protein
MVIVHPVACYRLDFAECDICLDVLNMHPCVGQVRVEIESLAEGVDLSEPLTRARFEELVGDLLKKTLGPVKKVRPPRRILRRLCTGACVLSVLFVERNSRFTVRKTDWSA